MSKLNKPARDALPDEHFAVPGKRKLPINDEHHTRLAWDMVDRTQDLTPEERSAARSRIIQRAHELGVDTADWHKMKAMHLAPELWHSIAAMSLNISNGDHPNKMAFSGILTRVDEPSDEPPGGSSGRRIIVTREAAEKALGSLLGMGIDFSPMFSGHDTQAKIGIITSANIVGNAIEIEGFVYASDFPEVAASIKSLQSALGFSFEAERIRVEDPTADILRITEMAFTGAAILRKDQAAYQTTSLAAAAAKDEHMTEELKGLLDGLAAQVTSLAASVEELKKAPPYIDASTPVIDKVEPHAATLEACHAAMEAAGIGMHPQQGHVITLKRMVGHMRAAAAMGKIPHIFRDESYPMEASLDDITKYFTQRSKEPDDMTPEDVTKAVEAAMKPVLDKLASAETQIADLKASAQAASPPPTRKTVSPMITTLLARAGITEPEGEEKLALAKVDEALSKGNFTTQQKIMLKNELGRAGAL